MQQFRPLPSFNAMEEAEPVEMPVAPTTDPLPAFTDPRFTAANPPPAFPLPGMADPRFPAKFPPAFSLPATTDPRLAAQQSPAFPMPGAPLAKKLPPGSARQEETDPRLAAQQLPAFPMPGAHLVKKLPPGPARQRETAPRPVAQQPAAFPMPTMTDPYLAAIKSQQSAPRQATANLPVVLFSGSSTSSETDQLAALMGKPLATGKHPALTAALQGTLGANTGITSTTNRLVVIPGSRKRRKTGKAAVARRLNPRLRQSVVLVTLLVIVVCTLTTLMPLSDSQNTGNIFSNLGNWFHSAQLDWNIQAHQASSTFPTALNGPGLPYMTIANSPYVSVAAQDARVAGIPYVYFVRQIQQESGYNPNAVSVTNAEGIAQFEPYTASGLGINPWDPNDALRGAAHLMANYYHQYGNYAKALGAYNAGPGAVQGAVYSCGTYWLSCMPAQSQDYVYRIMGV
ncbi:MAG TPA: transglycosylase SLT domain-containing protein [Ktedonobacteraceae bacterium]